MESGLKWDLRFCMYNKHPGGVATSAFADNGLRNRVEDVFPLGVNLDCLKLSLCLVLS